MESFVNYSRNPRFILVIVALDAVAFVVVVALSILTPIGPHHLHFSVTHRHNINVPPPPTPALCDSWMARYTALVPS